MGWRHLVQAARQGRGWHWLLIPDQDASGQCERFGTLLLKQAPLLRRQTHLLKKGLGAEEAVLLDKGPVALLSYVIDCGW
ncbi:hypothetical protein KSC_068180 [Ktedonobacter sp. SOSP1-52]|nr:hypothetical protein KSC_068180 [Ktedonobacter sp. SOSP1-52]